MRVFLDTNIFLEYFQRRTYHKEVSRIFDAIEDGNIKAYVSAGTIYTLAYLIRMELKRMQIHRPEQTIRLRTALNTILSLVSVGNVSHKNFQQGTNDNGFDDIEDSFQYQCAVQNKCDVIITINLHDYLGADFSKIQVLSPQEYVEKYL